MAESNVKNLKGLSKHAKNPINVSVCPALMNSTQLT